MTELLIRAQFEPEQDNRIKMVDMGNTKIRNEQPKRLTPKSDVLRELYLLSGNQCAMPSCRNVIIDDKGTVIGQVCHIEAAMPAGPRFNASQTNEQRRQLSNLVLICANHHLQIDSKKHEADWPLEKVRKLKVDHEVKFKAIPGSLEQRFEAQFADNTDAIDPTAPSDFVALEDALPDCKLEKEDSPKRHKQVKDFINKLAKVPDTQRDFILAVIKRAIKLDDSYAGEVSVHVEDVINALSIDVPTLKQLGDSLERLGVGEVSEVGTSRGDEWHVQILAPSEYLTWFDVDQFCVAKGYDLSDFVIYLKFGLLDK